MTDESDDARSEVSRVESDCHAVLSTYAAAGGGSPANKQVEQVKRTALFRVRGCATLPTGIARPPSQDQDCKQARRRQFYGPDGIKRLGC